MSTTGRVLCDIRDLDSEQAVRRSAILPTIPDGAALVILVGPLAVNPAMVWQLRDHVHRLRVEVWGEPHAVERWLDALNGGGMLGSLGVA